MPRPWSTDLAVLGEVGREPAELLGAYTDLAGQRSPRPRPSRLGPVPLVGTAASRGHGVVEIAARSPLIGTEPDSVSHPVIANRHSSTGKGSPKAGLASPLTSATIKSKYVTNVICQTKRNVGAGTSCESTAHNRAYVR
jgi:hypothetical protein